MLPDEEEFNRFASEELTRAYESETGKRLRFKRTGEPFPDAILETPEREEVGVEFVCVMLPFLKQEEDYFGRKYRACLLEAAKPQRPHLRNRVISFQSSHKLISSRRPYKLPDPTSKEGKRLVGEFAEVVRVRDWSPEHGGCVPLDASYPTLGTYFDPVLVNLTKEVPGHPDDPIITSASAIYRLGEVVDAVQHAIDIKCAKEYRTEMLVLHSLSDIWKRNAYSGVEVHVDVIVQAGRELVRLKPEITRFSEIWFLSACIKHFVPRDRHGNYLGRIIGFHGRAGSKIDAIGVVIEQR